MPSVDSFLGYTDLRGTNIFQDRNDEHETNMSLDVEGNGATCVECGVFDFLPSACRRCGGVYCRDHASKHHRPQQGGGPAREWCAPPQHATAASPPVAEGSEAIVTAAQPPQQKCCLCESTWCVLTPCPRCGECFCAAHRFHGHEEDDETGASGGDGAAARNRRFVPRAVPAHMVRQSGAPANSVTAACAAHGKRAALALAPPGYQSRMMELAALVCCRHSSSSGSGSTGEWQAAVCTLSVAVMATVGQMTQRCICELRLAATDDDDDRPSPLMDSPRLQDVCGLSGCFRLTAGIAAGTAAVDLRLELVPQAAVTKDALQPGEMIVLRVGPDSDVGTDDLQTVLGRGLFPPKPAVPDGGTYGYLARDDRVRAAVTRLRLHARPKGGGGGGGGGEAVAAAEAKVQRTEAADTDQSPSEAVVPVDASVARTDAQPSVAPAPWPFRAPPPMASLPFQSTKSNPLGTRQLGPALASRVLVAVFTEDRGLTAVVPIPPFVLAVGREWPAGKVAERAKEEACELVANAEDRRRVCAVGGQQQSRPFATYDVYIVGSASPSSPQGAVALLSQGKASLSAPPPLLLRDGDVLFLGSAAACAPGSGLLAEVERMKALKGKEQAAQRLEMMKKCSLM